MYDLRSYGSISDIISEFGKKKKCDIEDLFVLTLTFV